MKNCNKRFLSLFAIIFLSFLFFFPLLSKVEGVALDDQLTDFQEDATIGEASLGTVIGKVVKGILSIFGLVCLVIFIIAGFQWMNSGGHKEKIAGAQKSMGAAIIGMIIIIGAWAAVDFITEALSTTTDVL